MCAKGSYTGYEMQYSPEIQSIPLTVYLQKNAKKLEKKRKKEKKNRVFSP